MEGLLSANVLQPGVEILDPGGDVLQLALVAGLDLGGLADGQVETEPNAPVRATLAQPAGAARGRGRGEAEAVVAGVGC